eukprot:5817841-Pyramimonas_sp.AAC.1
MRRCQVAAATSAWRGEARRQPSCSSAVPPCGCGCFSTPATGASALARLEVHKGKRCDIDAVRDKV